MSLMEILQAKRLAKKERGSAYVFRDQPPAHHPLLLISTVSVCSMSVA